MRFGHWRGVMFAVALVASMSAGRTASADGFHHTIPREVLARDLATGQPYFAPAIPWGHYAKSGVCDHFGKQCSLCSLCRGKGCGSCGGKGCFGGLLGGHGGGHGSGLFGGPCGHGLFNHCKGGGDGCGDPGCGGGGHGSGRRVKDCGLCKGKGCGLCRSSDAGDPIHTLASSQSPAPARAVASSPQATPVASPQCGDPGCHVGGKHSHGGEMISGDPCDGCGGKGCGKCHGLGRLFGGHGGGDLCGSCGGKGCGLCGGLGRLLGKLCGACGGKGCGACGQGGHLKGKLAGLLHHGGKIKYFVGPGGPVPLTPGYVPYVVPTRSPRDFLAFPPYTPDGF